MSKVSQIDEARLGAYLESVIPGFRGLNAAEKFAGGQSNPTFRLEADSGTYVLRRKPPGQLLKSAHAVDREYRVMKALADTDVPVPNMLHLCEDDDVIGSMFYVMDFVRGRIFWDPTVPEVTKDERRALYLEMNRVLAAIHNVDLAKAGLEDYGKAGNYFERQMARWETQYRASELETIPEIEELISWLNANMVPDDGRVTLVHGDYRIDNIMFAPDSTKALAVVDWELSTLGHPFADLAYQAMIWQMPPGPVVSGLRGLDRAELGIPTDQEYIDLYCQRTGISGIDHWNFYVAFSFFRFAAIVQGVRKRAKQGNASNAQASLADGMVGPLARAALDIAGA